jgi:hypothetical protein
VNEAELRAYEDRVRHQAAPDLRAVLDNLNQALTVVYTAVAGNTRTPLPPAAAETIRRQFAAALDRLREQTDYGRIRRGLRDAARHAITEGARGVDHDVQVSPVTPLDVRWALKGLTAGLRADLADAARLVRTGKIERYSDLTSMATVARRAANRLDRASTWIVHRAHNEGVKRAAEKLASQGDRVAMLWVAEANACATCTGYAGAVAPVGEPFTPVMAVGDASGRPTGPVWTPPVHVNCRCSIEPFFGPTKLRPGDRPLRLRREAQRAVAAGQVQASEPAKARAADRLVSLADELLLTKTTKRRARRRARS